VAIPLTKEQQQAIDSTGTTPQEVVDPRTGEAYVLIRAEEYETVREVFTDERRQKAIRAVALRNAAGRMRSRSYTIN
jgi:PHD/YefM family antitoxin component YafN of YafNO toxin-antitoxin module